MSTLSPMSTLNENGQTQGQSRGLCPCIVACESLKPELDLVMQRLNCTLPIYWIEAGNHSWPDKLRVVLQEAIDKLPEGSTVLLVFGFCGNALVGINSGSHTLILPRVADCIPLFIGSRKERDAYGTDIYFFTEGYINSGRSIASDSTQTIKRYGETRGLAILKKMLCHYRNFTIIDTKAYNVETAKEKVDKFAKLVEIPVEVIPGNLRLFEALLSGSHNEDEFLTVPPGGSISFEDGLSAGKAQ